MHVISKEEADALNQEYTLAVLKQKLKKSVQVEGTTKPLPIQTRPINQNPSAGGSVQMESGPVNPANPIAQSPLNEEVSWTELARLREERARAKIAHEAYLEQYNEAKKREEQRAKDEAKVRKLEAKIEELRLKAEQAEIPPAAEGADPTEPLGTSGGQYDPQTEGRINPMFGGTTGRMEEPSEAQLMGANPQGKLPAEPGRSGSSGVYNTGSSVISLGHVPTLQKGFTALNKVLHTYCSDCGVEVSAEGDEIHFKKTGHAHFKKI